MKALPQLLFKGSAFDQLETTCMVLPFFADEKPLRGMAGLADWRMNGKISEQLLADRITGMAKETVLIPASHRLRAQNLLMLGMGLRSEFNQEIYQSCLAHLGSVLAKARLPKFAFVLNATFDASQQMLWLANFVGNIKIAKEEVALPLFWEVIAPEESFPSCEAILKKEFSKRLQFRFEAEKIPEQKNGIDR